VHMRFRPAPIGTGVIFVRVDLGPQAWIAAHIDNVTGTYRRTTLGDGPLQVGLVEHVLAALGGLHIDNCFVELNAPEPPGLDGSALGFVAALHEAGVVYQNDRRAIWGVEESILVQHGEATLALYPPAPVADASGSSDAPALVTKARGSSDAATADAYTLSSRNAPFRLRASYLLDYGQSSPIHPQNFTCDITPENFVADIAACRTFLLEEEARQLQQQGLGSRSKYKDLLVFGPRGPIDNQLRFANEPARHKILDIIGDLSLLGHDLCGQLVAYRSGHPLNVELVQLLCRKMSQMLPRCKLAA